MLQRYKHSYTLLWSNWCGGSEYQHLICLSDCICLISCFAHYHHSVSPVIRPYNPMKQSYHEILEDKNNFLNSAATRRPLCKRYTSRQEQERTPRELQGEANPRRISMFFVMAFFAEILQHMEISPDLKPAHNPQLLQRSVLQIWVPWIQKCFTGLETNRHRLSQHKTADRSKVGDWQQDKGDRS